MNVEFLLKENKLDNIVFSIKQCTFAITCLAAERSHKFKK